MSSTEWPERKVTVTVEVATEYVAKTTIDEADYLDWLGERADNDDSLLDYLRSGDEVETVGDICTASDADHLAEVTISAIVSVTTAETEATR